MQSKHGTCSKGNLPTHTLPKTQSITYPATGPMPDAVARSLANPRMTPCFAPRSARSCPPRHHITPLDPPPPPLATTTTTKSPPTSPPTRISSGWRALRPQHENKGVCWLVGWQAKNQAGIARLVARTRGPSKQSWRQIPPVLTGVWGKPRFQLRDELSKGVFCFIVAACAWDWNVGGASHPRPHPVWLKVAFSLSCTRCQKNFYFKTFLFSLSL